MNRRSILSISAMTALGLALLPGSALAQQKSLKEQLVGTWTLVSLDTVLPDGKKQQLYGANPKGIVIFDASGRFAQMQVPANRQQFKTSQRLEITAEEATTVMRGSFAEFGTWSVSEADKTIIQRIEASLIPNVDGTESKRIISSLTADELIWTTPGRANGGKNESVYRRAK